jgi:hypothetical protein
MKVKRNAPLERDIKTAICDYLTAKHYFFWSHNSAPSIQKSADGYLFPAHTPAG